MYFRTIKKKNEIEEPGDFIDGLGNFMPVFEMKNSRIMCGLGKKKSLAHYQTL